MTVIVPDVRMEGMFELLEQDWFNGGVNWSEEDIGPDHAIVWMLRFERESRGFPAAP